jgi:hypothetical protein
MRLFHVSEENNINVFVPRNPTRPDLDPLTPLVWAISEKCLPNFLTPRNCPRVTYYIGDRATEMDIATFLSSKDEKHVVAIEYKDVESLIATSLYLYEFDPSSFELQDANAGYYVSKRTEKPIRVIKLINLVKELECRQVELKIVNNLWALADRIKLSSLNWSLCRMNFASERRVK